MQAQSCTSKIEGRCSPCCRGTPRSCNTRRDSEASSLSGRVRLLRRGCGPGLRGEGERGEPAIEGGKRGRFVALGLLPWVPSPYTAPQEIERIVRPCGYVIVTSGNPFRLQSLVDPIQHPLLSPIKRGSKFVAGRAGVSLPVSKGVPRHWHSPRQLDLMLSSAGLEKVKSLTFGFGPLAFCRKRLPERFGVPYIDVCQSVADSGIPGLRSSGAIYMVLCLGQPIPVGCPAAGLGSPVVTKDPVGPIRSKPRPSPAR